MEESPVLSLMGLFFFFFFKIGKRTRKFYLIRNISANLPRSLIGPKGTLMFLVLSPGPMWLTGAGKELNWGARSREALTSVRLEAAPRLRPT